jgi:hypothetical protein
MLTVNGSMVTYDHPTTGVIMYEFVGEVFARPSLLRSLTKAENAACQIAWSAWWNARFDCPVKSKAIETLTSASGLELDVLQLPDGYAVSLDGEQVTPVREHRGDARNDARRLIGEPLHEFFVSVREKGRGDALLLGPYPTHGEALEHVDRGRKLAEAADRWTWFHSFGTCSTSPGKKSVFGQ